MTQEEKAKAFYKWLKDKEKIFESENDKESSKLIASIKSIYEDVFDIEQESEDERIRKRLICGMNALKDQKNETFAAIPIDDCIAWLEKQYVHSSNVGKYFITPEESLGISSDKYNEIVSDCIMGEPKWTDEDEIGSDATIELLEYFIKYAPEYRKPTMRRSIDWLKSIKKRMEEQQ